MPSLPRWVYLPNFFSLAGGFYVSSSFAGYSLSFRFIPRYIGLYGLRRWLASSPSSRGARSLLACLSVFFFAPNSLASFRSNPFSPILFSLTLLPSPLFLMLVDATPPRGVSATSCTHHTAAHRYTQLYLGSPDGIFRECGFSLRPHPSSRSIL